MKKLILVPIIAVFFYTMISSIATAQSNQLLTPIFPLISGENLNGKKFNLPQDLTADKTLLLIAFEREQQVVLDSWSRGLDLPNSQIPWVELPVIPTPYILGSFIIDSGMRRGIPNPKIRDKVITLYTDREAFAKSMGLDFDPQGAYVAVIDRSGKILGIFKGAFNEEKANTVLSLLGVK
jgi:hypothetical protein